MMNRQTRTQSTTASYQHGVDALQNAEGLKVSNGILVVSGYGIRIAVERGHLFVTDGVGTDRRTGLFSKATCGIRRLVVLGHSGAVSFEALRWLHDINASFVQFDMDGEVITASAALGLDDARLRRAQALAASSDTGMTITKQLLREKLEGQLAVLGRVAVGTDTPYAVQASIDSLDEQDTYQQIRFLEARGANAYWSAWSSVAMPFARLDAVRVPEHWLTMGNRSSPLTGSTRLAANPINALLNYLYAILEVEARIACLKVGLDPGMGLMHADQPNRDSLALDLLEPVRPRVDGLLLDLLARKTFRARDFFETREGVCRLMPSISKPLAEHAATLAKWVGPLAERTARELLHQSRPSSKPSSLPTPLTQANRSAGRDAVRTKPISSPQPAKLEVPNACKWCGVILEDDRRTWCESCYQEHRAEKDRKNIAKATAMKLKMAAAGNDPSHGGEVAKKRGATNRNHVLLNKEWERRNKPPMTEEEYLTTIAARLRWVSLNRIREIMEVSEAYAASVRTGRRVPHPRHWQNLLEIGEEV